MCFMQKVQKIVILETKYLIFLHLYLCKETPSFTWGNWLTEDNVISTNFGYDVFHGTFDTKLSRFGREEDFVSVTPASKEQRGLLFTKMKEAGYEWANKPKELK